MMSIEELDAAIEEMGADDYDRDARRRKRNAASTKIKAAFIALRAGAEESEQLRALLTEKAIEHGREMSDLRYQVAVLERDLEHQSQSVLNLADAEVFDNILTSAKGGKNLSESDAAHLQSLALLAREGRR